MQGEPKDVDRNHPSFAIEDHPCFGRWRGCSLDERTASRLCTSMTSYAKALAWPGRTGSPSKTARCASSSAENAGYALPCPAATDADGPSCEGRHGLRRTARCRRRRPQLFRTDVVAELERFRVEHHHGSILIRSPDTPGGLSRPFSRSRWPEGIPHQDGDSSRRLSVN